MVAHRFGSLLALGIAAAGCKGAPSFPAGDAGLRECLVGSWFVEHGGKAIVNEFRVDGSWVVTESGERATRVEGTWTVTDGAAVMTPDRSGEGATAAEAASGLATLPDSGRRRIVQTVLCDANNLSLEVFSGAGDLETFVGDWALLVDDGYRLRDGAWVLADRKVTTATLRADGSGGYRETVTSSYDADRSAWREAPVEDPHDYAFCTWSRAPGEFRARIRSEPEPCGARDQVIEMKAMTTADRIGFNAHVRRTGS